MPARIVLLPPAQPPHPPPPLVLLPSHLPPTPPPPHPGTTCTYRTGLTFGLKGAPPAFPSSTRVDLMSCQRDIRTSHATSHTSHVTRHTSHVTRHTSHVTRHTSHVTRRTSRSETYVYAGLGVSALVGSCVGTWLRKFMLREVCVCSSDCVCVMSSFVLRHALAARCVLRSLLLIQCPCLTAVSSRPFSTACSGSCGPTAPCCCTCSPTTGVCVFTCVCVYMCARVHPQQRARHACSPPPLRLPLPPASRRRPPLLLPPLVGHVFMGLLLLALQGRGQGQQPKGARAAAACGRHGCSVRYAPAAAAGGRSAQLIRSC